MRRACWPILLVAAAGCGGDKPKLVAVTGTVTMAGTGLTAGSLTFHPEGGVIEKGDRPSAQLQVDGSFAAQTYPYGDGMPPGAYKVTLSPELAARIRRPDYGKAETTPLRIAVPDAGVRDHKFEVK